MRGSISIAFCVALSGHFLKEICAGNVETIISEQTVENQIVKKRGEELISTILSKHTQNLINVMNKVDMLNDNHMNYLDISTNYAVPSTITPSSFELSGSSSSFPTITASPPKNSKYSMEETLKSHDVNEKLIQCQLHLYQEKQS